MMAVIMARGRIFLNSFNQTLKRRPLLVNAAIYGGTCAAGELTLQLINESDKPINWVRIAHFGIIGASFNGPVGHLWYTWLDKILPGTALRILGKKLFLDQTIAGSAYVVAFYVGLSALERQPDIFLECRQKFWETFRYSCCFWTCAQLINFLVLPTHLRVAYIATVNYLWTTILAIMKRVEVQQKTKPLLALQAKTDAEETTPSTDDSKCLDESDGV
ncbi:Mpv17-like protein [Holothuria leucospilota]|uniref:Mpv17-like protein n=1 Tax=Holothuria leucospilota TaxID=206669 RepID=A0A9Q1C3Z7_HOLLE|nr:Mpv17-like protein [Holothuria leucospilota]